MQNQPKFSPKSIQEATEMANSNAGRQLLHTLSQTHSKEMEQAFTLAASGDYAQLKKAMECILTSPEAQALVQQLRGRQDG